MDKCVHVSKRWPMLILIIVRVSQILFGLLDLTFFHVYFIFAAKCAIYIMDGMFHLFINLISFNSINCY